jgi:hypothetical protein
LHLLSSLRSRLYPFPPSFSHTSVRMVQSYVLDSDPVLDGTTPLFLFWTPADHLPAPFSVSPVWVGSVT